MLLVSPRSVRIWMPLRGRCSRRCRGRISGPPAG